MSETILSLINKSLFGTVFEVDKDADYAAAMQEARAQAVVGLVAPVIPESFREEWSPYANQIIINYIRNMHAQDELLRVFSTAGISVAILKGAAAAVYYPVPSRRTMGDIDFIVPQDRFEDACALMKANGYAVSHLEEEKYRHIGYSKGGVSFELHHHFSYVDLDIENYITEGMNSLEIRSFDGHTFPMLPPLANGLVLLAHMRSHLKSGLGLRQLIDWMMYVDKVLDDAFWKGQFHAAAKEKRLETLAIVATRLCQMYLGLSERITWCKGADEELCETLLDSLLESGNFGRKHGDGGKVETVATGMRSKGVFSYLQSAGEYNWKAYHKHKWLKPFAWLYQIFRYIRQAFSAHRGGKAISKDLDRSKARYEMLKRLGIE